MDELPSNYRETTYLKVNPDSIFMHANGEMIFGPFTVAENQCFISYAMLPSDMVNRANYAESKADGVDFKAEVFVSNNVFDSKNATIIAPNPPQLIQLKLPTNQAFTLRLSTHSRENNAFD